MTVRDLILLFILLLFVPSGNTANSSAKNMAEIHKICIKSPSECLTEVNQTFLTTKEHSRVWYDLLQYKIESLFLLQDTKELNKVTKPWIHAVNVPVPFKISIYIYYAKSLAYDEDIDKTSIKAERKKYIKKAEQQLDLMNNVYPNPELLIQLANIKMIVGEYTEAYQSLQSLAVKYKKHPDPAFKLELYGHLAHLADRLTYKQQAIEYWIESLAWAKKYENEQQIATVYYNLAQSQVRNDESVAAKQNYLQAIYHSTLANDEAKRAQSQYYLIELLFNQGLMVEAKEILDTIDSSKLTPAENKKLLPLKTAIYQESQ